jgi:very-short-patch-repair endonuclease
MGSLIEFRKRSNRLQVFKKQLRENVTLAEELFKSKLRQHKIKYQFQRPFFSKTFQCIADFYFKQDKANIIVEVDGMYHQTKDQKIKDEYRSKWLIENRGCKILRFTNDEVLNDIDNCLTRLSEFYLNTVGEIHNPSNNYLIFSIIVRNKPI